MHRSIPLACLLLAAPALSQVPSVGQVSVEEAQQELDALVKRMDAVRQAAVKAQADLTHARTEEDRTKLFGRIQKLGQELQELTDEFVHAVGLMKMKTNPVRAEIRSALQERDLKVAIKRLKTIETREAKKGSKILAIIQYSHAGAIRLHAEQLIKSRRNQSSAVRELRLAVKKYEDVLDATDMQDPEIGSSVHAVSLRHLVQIHAMLFESYANQYRQTRNKSARTKAENHRKAGIEFRDLFTRRHPDATNSDGSRLESLMQADVRRLTKRSPYR